jgi:hypothetical protein
MAYRRLICACLTACLLLFVSQVACGEMSSAASCEKAQAFRNERLLYDAAARQNRATLTEEMCALRLKIASADRKMSGILTSIAKQGEDHALRKEYDALGSDQAADWTKVDAIQKKLDALSNERQSKKISLKGKEMDYRYLCVMNDDLTKRLAAAKTSAKGEGFDELVKRRDEITSKLKESYDSYLKANAPLMEKFNRLGQSDAVSGADMTSLYDEIYKNFDLISDAMDSADEELGGISAELLKVIR